MRVLVRCYLTDRKAVARVGPLALVVVVLVLGALPATRAAYADWQTSAVYTIGAGTWGPDLSVPVECENITGLSAPIVGTEGDEDIVGTNGNDLIFGLGGNDVIQGGNGSDCIVGGAGNDLLGGDRQLENGEDVVLGGPGDDTISGGNAKDLLYGGDGDDFVDGRNGKDLAYGGPGNDTMSGSNATDLLDGGASQDVPDLEIDACDGGRAPDVYAGCEVIDGVSVTP